MTRNHIGVDLSKDFLDVCDPRRGAARVPNRPEEVSGWVAGLGPDDVIVFEATSGCDRVLRRAVQAAGIPGVRLNPLHAWHFARSLNLAKTDRVAQNARFQRDAAMLARLGAERQPEPDPAPDPAREDLRALGQRRDQLKRMEVQEKNRRAACPLEAVAAGIGEMLAILAAHIERIDKAIAEHVSRHPGLKSADRLLRSIPGFGAVAAVTMLAHVPELGTVSRRAAASLGGLAPRARDSGRHRGRRFIGGRHVRRVLFMAAMSLMHRPGFLADFIARKKAEGKPGKLILIAVARRLLTIANAVLRTGIPFQPNTRPAT
jgi:transposase